MLEWHWRYPAFPNDLRLSSVMMASRPLPCYRARRYFSQHSMSDHGGHLLANVIVVAAYADEYTRLCLAVFCVLCDKVGGRPNDPGRKIDHLDREEPIHTSRIGCVYNYNILR